MKIYTLVKTKLNDETTIWHFPILKAAQDKMLEICRNYFNGRAIYLNQEFHSTDGNFMSGDYYAVVDKGDKTEFDIFEKEINVYDYCVEAIIDKVIDDQPECECYIDILRESIESFGESNLPKLNDEKEIEHFIDYELTPYLADKATEKLFSEFEIHDDFEEEDRIATSDYLEYDRGLIASIQIINNEQSMIDEVKHEINDNQKREIFKFEYVWVYKSYWNDGKNFERKEHIKLFKNYDAARMTMESTMADVIKIFRSCYGENVIKTYKNQNVFQVCDEDVYDVWQGTLTKQYIED